MSKTCRKIQRYGWRPDLPDFRDNQFVPAPLMARVLPEMVDLRSKCPPILDQGNLGSCTGNAIASAFQFEMMRANKPNAFAPSRLFIYYNERLVEGTVEEDAGAQIRDGIKSVAALGVCPEANWPYDISQFAVQPPVSCYEMALAEQALKYRRISPSLSSMLTCLAMGLPFVFGFTVYSGFEAEDMASTGVLTMPQGTEEMLGGHAVMAVGYDRIDRHFIIRNSWGVKWGQDGYFTMPFDYLTNANLADDRWVISKVE